RMVRHTGCHAVMIGRGAIGNPWIFARMKAVDEVRPEPEVAFTEMCDVTIDHIRGEVAMRGEDQGCLVVRKHIAKCFKGYPGAAGLRKKLYATQKIDEMIIILEEAARRGDPRVDQP
ncbi:MAG: tRNA-dihydrouridine synthase, partial [Candidatus Krumholzibacteria bacterium]|nr:tRNA-dihydrouridine synthase [Candidatus Krumholzibacteria bacterium]